MPNYRTKEERAAYARAYYARPEHAEKNRARIIAKSAIESGKLERLPCQKCGDLKAEAHHEDYSKPLDVQWLCKKCHGLAHRKTHCAKGHALTAENVVI